MAKDCRRTTKKDGSSTVEGFNLIARVRSMRPFAQPQNLDSIVMIKMMTDGTAICIAHAFIHRYTMKWTAPLLPYHISSDV